MIYSIFIQLFYVILLQCLHYVNLVTTPNVFKLYNFVFHVGIHLHMCFLEKDNETSCLKLKWKKGKMDVHRVLDNWTLTHPSFEKHILPNEIFEKILTTEEMERICLE